MPFVVSEGQVNSVRPAAGALGSAITAGINLSPQTYQTYEDIYKTQPALRTVVSFLARNIAELPIDVFRRVSDNDRVKDKEHPLSLLLERPVPGTKWTRYKLINWIVHELCIYDCAFLLKSTGLDGNPALLPVPRRYMATIGENLFFPEKYRLTGSRGFKDFNPEDVVHLFGYSPDDPRNGVSPIETLRQILAEDYAATQYREQLWRNGARIGGVINRPPRTKGTPDWSDTARARFARDWQNQWTGEGLYSAGGTPILEDGMTYTPSSVSPREAQYAEARQLTREEVCIAYHINPSIMGLTSGQTQGNQPEIHKMLYTEGLGPLLTQISQDFENQLLVDLDPSGVDSVYVEFNIRAKLAGSFEEQAAAISSSVGGPWMTRSEARSLFNLPHLDDADDLITPMNVTAGGLASPRDTAPDNPSNEASNGQLPAAKPAGVSA